jgi:DNA-binding MarR family transcriptional regulator
MTVRKPDSPPAAELPDHLARWLEALNRRMSADLRAEVLGSGLFLELRPSDRRILQMIPTSRAIRITDLATVASMTKQALGEFVDRLEQAGFVTSARAPADGRVRLVSRTERGDEVATVTGQAIEAVEKRWRAEIGSAAYDAMMSAMRRLGRDSFAAG